MGHAPSTSGFKKDRGEEEIRYDYIGECELGQEAGPTLPQVVPEPSHQGVEVDIQSIAGHDQKWH